MLRILFTISLVYIISACSSSQTNTENKLSTKKLNFVWIVAEDLSPRLAAFGDSTIYTPNIDRLAKEGVCYDNVYSVSGVCAPSRSALITGMYPTSIGTHNMRTLKHNNTHIPGYSVVIPEYVKCFTEELRKEGYFCVNNSKTDYQFETPITAWDLNKKNATWKSKPDSTPFFYAYHPNITHESRLWNKENKPLVVDPVSIELPPYYPDTKLSRHVVARHYSNILSLDTLVGEVYKKLIEANELENTVFVFMTDHGDGLPRFKREITDQGTKVPMIIRFPNMKNAGERVSDLISFVDFAPTFLSLANIKIPDHIQGKAFLGEQKANRREYIFAARDRMDTKYDICRSVRDERYTLVHNYKPNLPHYQNITYRLQVSMMPEWLELNKKGKLNEIQSRWFNPTKPEFELYDNYNDPYGLVNLADSVAYDTIKNRLTSVLDQWVLEVEDKGFIDEEKLLQEWWPNLQQPITEPPLYKIEGDKMQFSASTIGSSITYKKVGKSNTSDWKVYNKPVLITGIDSIYVSSIRYGYKQSEIIKIPIL